MTESDNNAGQPEGCAAVPCWGLACNMEKSEQVTGGTQVTKRLMVGYQFATTEDEAIGRFLRMAHKENPGFTAGEPCAILIPNASQQQPSERHGQ